MAETKTPPLRSEADAIADLTAKSQQFPFVHQTADGRLLAMIPGSGVGGGWEMKDVSDPQRATEKPPHIKQAVTLQTLDSLVDYATRFRGENTMLFADIDANSIRAAIDYHSPAESGADRVAHSASMVLPYSVEWAAWAKIDGKLMEQLEFARYIEENAADIVAPSGADLLEVCRDLQAKRTVDFRKAVRTSTDNENFEFTDETTATSRSSGGALEVPSKFKLEIPVYFGQPNTTVFAFLRWRLEETKLLLGIQLHRAEHVRQSVFKQIVLDAAERIERPAVFGKLGA